LISDFLFRRGREEHLCLWKEEKERRRHILLGGK